MMKSWLHPSTAYEATKLLPQDLREKLPPLYANEALGTASHRPGEVLHPT